jgi:hypothetical protein
MKQTFAKVPKKMTCAHISSFPTKVQINLSCNSDRGAKVITFFHHCYEGDKKYQGNINNIFIYVYVENRSLNSVTFLIDFELSFIAHYCHHTTMVPLSSSLGYRFDSCYIRLGCAYSSSAWH